MEVKPLTLANIVLTTILLTSMFFLATRSASTVEYDHWIDYNDDGKIDLVDLYQIILNYGAEGLPINKTELLLDIQTRLERLETIHFGGLVGYWKFDEGIGTIAYDST